MQEMEYNTDPIEVSVRDTKKALEILNDLGIDFIREYTNSFLIRYSEEWNDAMQVFDETGIELI